jgi:hypothetical protein
MSLVFADSGATDVLGLVKSGSADYTLFLFATNVTPARASTVASFTEAAGGGYAAKTLTMASATVGDDGSGNQCLYWGTQTFTFTDALTTNPIIYGYGIKRGTVLIAAELTPQFQPEAGTGGNWVITPKIPIKSA